MISSVTEYDCSLTIAYIKWTYWKAVGLKSVVKRLLFPLVTQNIHTVVAVFSSFDPRFFFSMLLLSHGIVLRLNAVHFAHSTI